MSHLPCITIGICARIYHVLVALPYHSFVCDSCMTRDHLGISLTIRSSTQSVIRVYPNSELDQTYFHVGIIFSTICFLRKPINTTSSPHSDDARSLSCRTQPPSVNRILDNSSVPDTPSQHIGMIHKLTGVSKQSWARRFYICQSE